MKYRTITIEPVLNGLMCHIGCQRAVFESPAKMLAELKAYYEKPDETEKKYLEESLVGNGPVAVGQPTLSIGSSGITGLIHT